MVLNVTAIAVRPSTATFVSLASLYLCSDLLKLIYTIVLQRLREFVVNQNDITGLRTMYASPTYLSYLSQTGNNLQKAYYCF